MGSKPGGIVALDILIKRKWNILYVVPSVVDSVSWISDINLDEFSYDNKLVNLKQDEIPIDTEVDYVISYMYRNKVKLATLNMARKAALNFHAGPLPEYGGWAFYNLAILENSFEYGCTCHYMDENFDTGPLLKVRRFPIDPKKETAYSLEKKAQHPKG